MGTLLHISPLLWLASLLLLAWGIWDLKIWRRDRDKAHLRDGIFLAALAVLDLAGACQEQRKVEASDAELSAVREKVTPRHLTDDQRQRIIEGVKSVGGVPPFEIKAPVGSTEAQAYAAELTLAFQEAGCNVSSGGMDTGIPPGLVGLSVAIGVGGAPRNQQLSAPLGMERLKTVMSSAGLELSPMEVSRPNVPYGQFQLVVAGKP